MKLPAFTLDASARVWHRLWSVRFALAAALASVLSALESVLPLWHPVLGEVPYAAIATLLAGLSALARVVHQPAAQRSLDDVRDALNHTSAPEHRSRTC